MRRLLVWKAPFVVRSLLMIIFILFSIFTLYEWKAIASEPKTEILPLHYELSTPISSSDSSTVEGFEADADAEAYREVFSVSTSDKRYFLIDFVDRATINPNIVPHPLLEDTWVIVAQGSNVGLEDQKHFVEISCNATFQNGVLRCTHSPVPLPVAATHGEMCKGNMSWFNLSVGPHDARVLYGPKAPYIVYGSNSVFTCFGQWVQDLRSLWDWGTATFPHPGFENGTELQRPPPYGVIEKNYFLFWDQDDQVYAHYDVSPKRAFAKLGLDGSVGKDLAPKTAQNDDKCMARYMPHIEPKPKLESIHQATNSLSVTLCKRSDPACKPNEKNTFIFTIFQWKSFINLRSNYEPYVMVFEQKAPFPIHGISTKPIWIHGRGKANQMDEETKSNAVVAKRNNGKKPWDQTEMLYITSMSWKSSGLKYHGYIDDVVFLAFGVEDARSAGIDVVVGDLLLDLGLCINS
jgi:hypothetical protein